MLTNDLKETLVPGMRTLNLIWFAFTFAVVIYAVLASILGAYLGVITLLGDSIRTSILCHGANNLVAVLTAAWGLVTCSRPGG